MYQSTSLDQLLETKRKDGNVETSSVEEISLQIESIKYWLGFASYKNETNPIDFDLITNNQSVKRTINSYVSAGESTKNIEAL